MKTKKKANQVKKKSNEQKIFEKILTSESEYVGTLMGVPLYSNKNMPNGAIYSFSSKSNMEKKEKPLTKAELLKLYEEFKEKKKAEYEEELKIFYGSGWNTLVVNLEYSPKYKSKFKVYSLNTIKRLVRELEDAQPTYTEPTFNEFMESLGEIGESHKAKAFLNYYRLSDAERAGLLIETN